MNPPLGHLSDLGAIAWRHQPTPGRAPGAGHSAQRLPVHRRTGSVLPPASQQLPARPALRAMSLSIPWSPHCRHKGQTTHWGWGETPPCSSAPSILCGVAWQHTQSVETYFHGKIRSTFGFRVAEIAQAPTVMQLPICPSFPGGRAATGLNPCPQAPPAWGKLGDTAGLWQCCSPAATQQRKGRGPSQTVEKTK